MRLLPRLTCLALFGCFLTGCGKALPTAPGPVSPAGPVAPVVGITDLSVKEQTARFIWNPVPGATGYVLEIGRTSGGKEIAEFVFDGAVTSHRVDEIPTGIAFARVRARTDSTTNAAGRELRFIVPDMRDVIEALFLNSGPHADSTSDRSVPVMLGWPEGTVLRTRTAGLTDGQYEEVERGLEQIEKATNGAVRAAADDRRLNIFDFFVGPPAPGELHVGFDPYLPVACTSHWVEILPGCTELTDSNGVILAARAMTGWETSGVYGPVMHHIGHAALGLSHIQLSSPDASWPGIPFPTMSYSDGSGPLLTPMELDAIEMVYAAGLRGGAERSAFYAAGLIKNP